MTKVLVIDDEAPIRLLCRVNLEAEGMDVIEAADGPSGLERAREHRPDVVLLDVMMPGLDGWRVAEHLLEDERTSEIPIIFLTARAEFRDRARGLDIGGVDYVTKPFNPLELAPLVRELLARIERGERDELRGREARRAPLADGDRLVRTIEGTPSPAPLDLPTISPELAAEVGGDDRGARVPLEGAARDADADPAEDGLSRFARCRGSRATSR